MTDRDIMQQALDALDYEAERGNDDGYRQLRDALRERLAQPEQELVIDCPRCGHCCPRSKPLTDAVLAEREACAAMLDENAMACENPIYRSLLQANAQAIREMGQP